MFKHRAAPLLVLLFVLFARSAQAFGGPPYLVPANPTPTDTISVDILGDGCDILDTDVVPVQITQQENAITATFFGVHEGDPISCIYGTGAQTYPVRSWPVGSYTLTVVWNYFGAAGEVETQTLGVLPFNVTGTGIPPTAAVGAPTLGIAGLGILLLGVVGVAGWSLRRQLRSE